MAATNKKRCDWCLGHDIYEEYHDVEWGVPVRDSRELFEHLCLDGAQAGLSWLTILKKRENYREAFDGFDPQKMARYGDKKITELLNNPGIIRNKLKVRAFVTNAQAFLDFEEKEGSFGDFLWGFVDGSTIVNHPKSMKDFQATSPESDEMSKALKKVGFKFVGSTICYAFMQAVGMVDDHLDNCFRKPELKKLRSS